MGVPLYRWMVYFMENPENPNLKLMINVGTHILGNPYHSCGRSYTSYKY